MDNYISIVKKGRLYVTANEGYVVCLNGGIGGQQLVTSEANVNLVECITISENAQRIEREEREREEREREERERENNMRDEQKS
jgi:hypothetical protein